MAYRWPKGSFSHLWANYPKHSEYDSDPKTMHTQKSVWSLIGGHVEMNEWSATEKQADGSPMFNNTCAIRMSRALNYTGITIPMQKTTTKSSDGKQHTRWLTVSGNDGKNYFLTVAGLQMFLERTLGQPEKIIGARFTSSRTITGAPSNASGIISFNDATGHFTLWDGVRQTVIDMDVTEGESYPRWPQPTSTLFWEVQ